MNLFLTILEAFLTINGVYKLQAFFHDYKALQKISEPVPIRNYIVTAINSSGWVVYGVIQQAPAIVIVDLVNVVGTLALIYASQKKVNKNSVPKGTPENY